MAKIEDQLAALSALDIASVDAQTLLTLGNALASRSNHVIAKAAQLVGDHRITELTDDLVRAYERLMVQPAKLDKGAFGLTALARALALLDYPHGELFRQGSRLVQFEPVYGGRVDVADHLRGWCAQGLVVSGDPDAMVDVARLLADPCPQTRKAAAQAVQISGMGAIGVPLLVLRTTLGDADPQVVAQCVIALLALDAQIALSYIQPLLQSEDEALVEQILLAMGQARAPQAMALITSFYESALTEPLQKASLLALAMLRTNEAITYLIEEVAEASPRAAALAIEALGIYDEKLKERLVECCKARGDGQLKSMVEDDFD
jgi:hypothetical protein